MATGNSKATKLFDIQAEAKKFGKDQARKNHSELLVHGKDGRIRSKDSFGNDPYPPKDLEH